MAAADSMNLPRITVVVPALNQGQFLGEALQSIVDQNYPSLELIVMDGGSTDNSVEVIKGFEPFISYWQSRPDGGQSAAINAGMERATGDLVCWLNSDDLLCADALTMVGGAASRHPGFGLYIGNGLRLDEGTQSFVPVFPAGVVLNRQALREGLNYILQPSVFFSRAAWSEAGGLDPNLHYVMDWDILNRVAMKHRAVLIDAFLAVGREYKDTKTASGGIDRAIEILQMCKTHSGQHVSTGASLFLLEALLQEGTCDHLGVGFHRHIMLARLEAARMLVPLTGRSDGFPTQSDPGDVTYVPAVPETTGAGTVEQTRDPAWRGTAKLLGKRLWNVFPRVLPYAVVSEFLVLAMRLKLVTPEDALGRMRGLHKLARLLPARLSRLSATSRPAGNRPAGPANQT